MPERKIINMASDLWNAYAGLEVLNTPAGISRYPYNGMILFMTLLGIVIAIMGAFLKAVGLDE